MLLPENYNFFFTLVLEHVMGLSDIVFLNGAHQNGDILFIFYQGMHPCI